MALQSLTVAVLTSRIYAALSEQSCETVIAALKTAKKYGTIISYDLNYRPSQARNDLAVRILPSPGSRRSITSPSETASYLHSFAGFKL